MEINRIISTNQIGPKTALKYINNEDEKKIEGSINKNFDNNSKLIDMNVYVEYQYLLKSLELWKQYQSYQQ